MKYIAYPISLTFNLRKDRHSVSVMERFGQIDNKIPLGNNIKAQIAGSYEEAVDCLREQVKKFVTRYDGVRASDFDLRAQVEEIAADGTAWGPGGRTGQRFLIQD